VLQALERLQNNVALGRRVRGTLAATLSIVGDLS